MDESTKKILNEIGIFFENIEDLNGQIIPRELLLNNMKYDNLKDKIDINIIQKIIEENHFLVREIV